MKKILLILPIFLFLFFPLNAFAKVTINGVNIPNNSYYLSPTGNNILRISQDTLYNSITLPTYFKITMCFDNNLSNWTQEISHDDNEAKITFYKTNISCQYPGSSYQGGRILYIYGKTNHFNNCGMAGTNCYLSYTSSFYTNFSSWTLLNEEYSTSPISVDFSSTSMTDTFNNNTNNIINNNNNNFNKVIEENKKRQEYLENNKTDKTEEKGSDFIKNFKTSDPKGISSIITLPLNFIKSLTTSSCKPLLLPLPFVTQKLTLPCMINVYRQISSEFLLIYQTITFGIISYLICLRFFFLIKNFKDPNSDKIEVVDL